VRSAPYMRAARGGGLDVRLLGGALRWAQDWRRPSGGVACDIPARRVTGVVRGLAILGIQSMLPLRHARACGLTMVTGGKTGSFPCALLRALVLFEMVRQCVLDVR